VLPNSEKQQLDKHSDKPLRVDLLGVPTIFWQGAPLDLSRRQARAILYPLACAGKPLGREKLADLLWPEKEPSTARRNLVRLLSLLRTELPERELLGSDNTAVWLNPGQTSCDVWDFLHLSKSTDYADWQSAVSLYRGPFLSGFALDKSHAFDDWQQAMEYDLERKYLELLARLVKKAQAMGETAEAIAYAKRYLAIDDLAETIHRALIALYAARGERTAALQQYSRCVAILHNELGVDPLPETRAMYEAARDGNLAPRPLPVPEPTWSTLPGLEIPLTGREQAWDELEEAYRQEKSGGAILIGGEAGVGKSRLMQEFAPRQAGRPLVGNCHTGSQALFFQPLVQALRQGLIDVDQVNKVKRIWLAELSVLLPELRDQFPDLPPPLPLEPAQSQARLLEALTQAFRGLAAESPLLLCLDDLHAADDGTLAWLTYTTGQLAGSGICILATYRTQNQDFLAAWQRALSRSARGSHIHLKTLDRQAVQSLMELAGMPQETAIQLARSLHEATGGNAYFLLETIRELLESGGLQAQQLPLPLPQTVREAVLRRADRLLPLTRQVLDMAAVLSPLLEVSLLAEASARSELDVAGALDDLVRRQLLVPEGSRFRFQHDLTREAIYREISDWRTRLLHRRAAQVLEQQHERQSEYTALIAAHYEAAGDYSLAFAKYRQAIELARAFYAHQDAIRLLHQAIDLLPKLESPGNSTEFILYEMLGDLQLLIGEYVEARDSFKHCLKIPAEKHPLDQARLYYKMGRSWSGQLDYEETAQHLQFADKALAIVQDQASNVWIHMWLDIKLAQANLYYLHNRWAELAKLCNMLQEPITESGTLKQQADFFSTLVMLNNRQLRFAPSRESVEYARHALAIAEELDDKSLIAWKTFSVGFQLLWFGELVKAEKIIADSLLQAEEIGDLSLINRALTYLIITLRLAGNEDLVRQFVETARDSSKEEGARFYTGSAEANSAWLEYRSGHLLEANLLARKAMKYWENLAYPFQWQALLVLLAIALDRGDHDKAVSFAVKLIDPSQQLLPDPLQHALKTAVNQFPEQGKQKIGANALLQAVNLAAEYGYL
jgi:DNA-binding SARP family transcriptional activator